MLTFIWKTVQLSLSLFEMHYLFASGKKRIGFASNSSAFSASTSVSVLLACVHLHCLCDSTLASHRVWTLTTLNIYSIIAKSRGACQKNICLGFFWLVPTLWRGAFSTLCQLAVFTSYHLSDLQVLAYSLPSTFPQHLQPKISPFV